MNELASLPTSIRQRLEQAQAMLADNQQNTAQQATAQQLVAEAVRTLASSNPELCALLIAGHMGFRGFAGSRTLTKVTTKEIPRKLWGFDFGHDVETTTETQTTSVSFRLF